MSRKIDPQYYDEERQLLEEANPKWKDPVDEENEEENDIKQKLSDKHQLIEAELLGSIEHGGGLASGGYLQAPNSGRGVSGGAWPLMLAPLVASLFMGGSLDETKKPKVAYGIIHTKKPLDMSSAANFYRSLSRLASSKTSPGYVEKKMSSLLTPSIWRSIKKNKVGGSLKSDTTLRMGHLLYPMLQGHATKALGKPYRAVLPRLMSALEQVGDRDFARPVTADVLRSGGSIFSTLIKGAKNLFQKIIGNKAVKGIVGKVGEAGSKALESAAPALTENVIKKVTDYANKKLTEEGKQRIDVDDIESMRELVKKKDRKQRAKKLLEQAEEDDERRQRRRRRTRAKAKAYADEDEEDEDDEDEDEEIQVEPSRVGTLRRKAAVANKKALVPTRTPGDGRRIIGWSAGQPIYEGGLLKKKTYGGAWTVKLKRV
jgi:hypothetical protein